MGKHLEAFSKGTSIGIRGGHALAAEQVRELANAARAEGRTDAAKALDEAHAHLSERLVELETIHARLDAERKGEAKPEPQIIPPSPRGCCDGD